jgi:hypothetical protein
MDNLMGFHRLARRLHPLGITRVWLKAEMDAGRIPYLRIGRRTVFNFDAVVAAIGRQAAEGNAGHGQEAVHA